MKGVALKYSRGCTIGGVVCRTACAVSIFVVFALFSGCSINKLAVGAISDGLGGGKKGAGGGGASAVFASDSDPVLVGDALPFAVKMYEALLSMNPKHQGLAVTTGSLFVMYANAFVQGPAFMYDTDMLDERAAANDRAKKLYVRGADILLNTMDTRFPKWADAVDTPDFLKSAKADDVPLLYWTAAANLSAWAVDPVDINLGARLHAMLALLNKAYTLDGNFNSGAIDELFVTLYASLPDGMEIDKVKSEKIDNAKKARQHFDIAMEKSGGNSVSLYVSWAQAVAVTKQDYTLFKDCLTKALLIDVDKDPGTRLVNILAQQKARYLLSRAPYLFVDTGDDEYFEAWD
jgi:hypothetical protein